MRRIILASASPRRRELLEQIGVSFEVMVSGAEENMTAAHPGEAVRELSAVKAEAVFKEMQGDVLVLGADTAVASEGEILGKPKGREEAVRMLQQLQGKTHQVYTGVTVLVREGGKEQQRSFYEKTDVTFYPMEPSEIESYADTGEPADKAGAYGIQGKSAVFVQKIDGDYSNVVGLPLSRVYQEIKQMGIDIREWQK